MVVLQSLKETTMSCDTTHQPSPLDYNPFEGDFGEPGDRTLRDKMVRAKKAHTCSNCKGPIVIGEHHRSRTELSDGSIMQFRWCALCCDAMVKEIQEFNEGEPTLPFYERSK